MATLAKFIAETAPTRSFAVSGLLSILQALETSRYLDPGVNFAVEPPFFMREVSRSLFAAFFQFSRSYRFPSLVHFGVHSRFPSWWWCCRVARVSATLLRLSTSLIWSLLKLISLPLKRRSCASSLCPVQEGFLLS